MSKNIAVKIIEGIGAVGVTVLGINVVNEIRHRRRIKKRDEYNEAYFKGYHCGWDYAKEYFTEEGDNSKEGD